VLSGKYTRADVEANKGKDMFAGGRAAVAAGTGSLSEHNLDIVDALKEIAADVGHSPAQTAIAWLLAEQAPRVIPILGARTAKQFEENLAALDVTFTPEQMQRLDEVSAIDPIFPHRFLPRVTETVSGGASITRGW
jgi:aryl-alcohol dehydrogenase-like predicted oxidoreductase